MKIHGLNLVVWLMKIPKMRAVEVRVEKIKLEAQSENLMRMMNWIIMISICLKKKEK